MLLLKVLLQLIKFHGCEFHIAPDGEDFFSLHMFIFSHVHCWLCKEMAIKSLTGGLILPSIKPNSNVFSTKRPGLTLPDPHQIQAFLYLSFKRNQ